jgi:hypothetical protein
MGLLDLDIERRFLVDDLGERALRAVGGCDGTV